MGFWLLYACLFMSAITFLIYGIDKRRAKKRHFRVSESVLLGTGFFGGALGALLAMNLFRHKTRRWYFWFINGAGLIWQVKVFLWLSGLS